METRVVVSGIVRYRERYLVLKRSLENYSPGDWEFVMGFIQEKETAESAILREIEEETGQKGVIEKYYPVVEILGRSGRYVIIPYLVGIETDDITLSEEHSEYDWSEKDKLSDYKGMISELINLIK